jgi:hypothetical protein
MSMLTWSRPTERPSGGSVYALGTSTSRRCVIMATSSCGTELGHALPEEAGRFFEWPR